MLNLKKNVEVHIATIKISSYCKNMHNKYCIFLQIITNKFTCICFMNISFINCRRDVDDILQCFWLSSDYYENAVIFYNKCQTLRDDSA